MVNEVKISKVRQVRSVSSLKKKPTDKKEFNKELSNLSKNEAVDTTSNIMPISNNLYTLQENEENFPEEQRDLEYGKELLNLLEKYRRKLILNKTTTKELGQIKNSIEVFQLSAKNDKLRKILNEIELRAKIELAKRGITK